MATIATHNRSSVSRGHNLRKEEIVSKESHIDPDGVHETWIDEAPRHAYERIFGQSVRDYNERQPRADRQIKDYYNHVRDDAKKHCTYEMIIGVYPGDGETVTEKQGRDIMREFVSGWKERNPNLELVGAYYHADEQGKAPHVHIDYIPVAHGYKNGPETQNGIVKALGEQGFRKQGTATAQILWEKRENECLEKLCCQRGISVEHPEAGKGVQHLHTEAYKASQDARTASETLKGIQKDIEDAESVLEGLQGRILTAQQTRAFTVKRKLFGGEKAAIEGSPEELQSLLNTAAKVEAADKAMREAQDIRSEAQKIIDMKSRIVEAAEAEAKRTRSNAEADAKQIRSNAQTAAERIKKNTEKEYQILQAEKDGLQQEIDRMSSERTFLEETVKKEKAELLKGARIEAEGIIADAYREAELDRLNAKIDEKLGIVSLKETEDARQAMLKAYRQAEPHLTEDDIAAAKALNHEYFYGRCKAPECFRSGTPDNAIMELQRCIKQYTAAKESPHSAEEIIQSLTPRHRGGPHR